MSFYHSLSRNSYFFHKEKKLFKRRVCVCVCDGGGDEASNNPDKV